jgi:sialate O-acetylesterase
MEGGGLLREALSPDERVWSFSPAGVWEVATEPLHRPWESFTESHPVRLRADVEEASGRSNEEMALIAQQTQVTGAGLGLAFGIELAERRGGPIGLVPCAHGGSSLVDWSAEKKSSSDLYGAMLERVRLAGGRPAGLVWYQGESDTSPVAARGYAENLASWICDVRVDLGANLPVYLVQLGRFVADPLDLASQTHSLVGWETVREGIRCLPEHLENCHGTSAIDLGLHVVFTSIHPAWAADSLDWSLAGRLPLFLARSRIGKRSRFEEVAVLSRFCCNLHGSTWKRVHPLAASRFWIRQGIPTRPRC